MKKYVSPTIRILLILSALFGTGSRLVLSLPRESGWKVLLYFTVQSNLMVCAYLLTETFRRGNFSGKEHTSEESLQYVHGAILLYISITGLVFNVLLAPTIHAAGFNRVIMTVNHTVTPLLFILDWLGCQRRYSYSVKAVLPWLAYPIAYMIFSSIEGALTQSFRYPFLDFSNRSIASYLTGMILVTSFFLVLAYGYIGINRITRKKVREAGHLPGDTPA